MWSVRSIAIDDQRRDVTWHNVGRPIARLNRDRQSSLKGASTWRDLICRRIVLISAFDQEELRQLRLKPTKNASERLIKIQRRTLQALLITLTTWLHLDSRSKIQWPRLNRKRIASEMFHQSRLSWIKRSSDGYAQISQ